LVLHKRPSEILQLKGEVRWLFEVDYYLTMQTLEKITEGKEESTSAKAAKMKKWVEETKHGST
jgi:hypothetical protein